MDAVNKITKNTLVPISLVMVVIGAVSWITNIWYETKANGDAIREVKQQRDIQVQTLLDINTRLSRIEGKLDNLKGD